VLQVKGQLIFFFLLFLFFFFDGTHMLTFAS
jgi:hypothetical protein